MALLVWGSVASRTIPAAGKHEFKANTIQAIGIQIGLIWKEVTVQGALRSNTGCIVETVETECGLTKEILGFIDASPIRLWDVGNWVREVSLVRVARNHLKASREGSDIGNRSIASIWVQKVVSGMFVSECHRPKMRGN
jgi:hypothetical protein